MSLSSTGYRVSETAGQATVTVNRTGSLHGDEYVRYGTHRANAVGGIDYQTVGGTLHFLPGQGHATFTVPIIAHDWRGPSVHAAVYLYGSFPEKLGPHNAKLFILHDAPVETRDPTNPLELPGVPNAPGNLLANARFYADPHHSPAAEAARRLRRRHPKEAGMIQEIADQPFTDRFGSWNGRSPESAVFQFLRNADVQTQRRSPRWPRTGSSTVNAPGAAPRTPRAAWPTISGSSTASRPGSATSAPSSSWRWTR